MPEVLDDKILERLTDPDGFILGIEDVVGVVITQLSKPGLQKMGGR